MIKPRKEKTNILNEFRKLQEQSTDYVLNFINHCLGENYKSLHEAIYHAEPGILSENLIEPTRKYASIMKFGNVTPEDAEFAIEFHMCCKTLMLEK